MKLRNHASKEEAMREARKAGYWPLHRPDGREVWGRKGSTVTLTRETKARSTQWHWTRQDDAS